LLSASILINGYYYLRSITSVKICCPLSVVIRIVKYNAKSVKQIPQLVVSKVNIVTVSDKLRVRGVCVTNSW
jgi:hypothetical protein